MPDKTLIGNLRRIFPIDPFARLRLVYPFRREVEIQSGVRVFERNGAIRLVEIQPVTRSFVLVGSGRKLEP